MKFDNIDLRIIKDALLTNLNIWTDAMAKAKTDNDKAVCQEEINLINSVLDKIK
jgi:hypothetical protein